MTETGLLVAQGAFLVLLYLFVWSLVRSSSRDLRETEPLVAAPQPVAVEDGSPIVDDIPEDFSPAVEAIPVVPAPVAEPDVPDAAAIERAQRRPSGPSLDLTTHIEPRLVVEKSPSLAPGSEYPLEAGMTIGRSRSNGIPLSDQFVSHMHARVYPNGQFFFIEDLGSTNGTFLNGHKVEEPTQLKVRDLVSFGDTVLRYEE